MTTASSDIFTDLSDQQDKPAEMLDRMVQHFREARKPMELFEARKMCIRQGLGMPLMTLENEATTTEETERQLEAGLLDACREAGTMLIEEGRIAEGWMYLRPTGDTELAKTLMGSLPINDDNYDDMIQVLLHEGVDVQRGYQAILDQQGTCNSITMYEQSISQRSLADQRIAASCLLNHLYGELITMVRGDIAEKEAPAGDDETLAQMIDSRRWILGDGGYHLDTTHLAATVRIATVLTDKADLQKAWELTQYGRRLNHQFQYPGEEPFVDFYPAYSTLFATLLGEDVDLGIKYFLRKAKSVDVEQHGTAAIETYINLLDRCGRHGEAIDAAINLIPSDIPTQRTVPLLIEIAGRGKEAGNESAFDQVLEYCQNHKDVLGYAAALHARQN